MFELLKGKGFQIAFESHAAAILNVDFTKAVNELEQVLTNTNLPIEHIIAGGGGEAEGTQRFRRELTSAGWPKTIFRINETSQLDKPNPGWTRRT